jgi:hypothetical protein
MEASSQLDALLTSSGFALLSRYTKAFDLFRVMGVSSKELVRSNILAAFMDEREAHCMGALFRDAYVVSLGQLPCIGTPLLQQVRESTTGAKAKVARELAHIDILLVFPSLRLVIAIENKIWAADQHNQVASYQEALCELYPHFEGEMEARLSSNPDKQKYDLDVRLRSWPEGVWVKIYKHTWFGVFPFFRAEDLEALIPRLPSFTQPAHAVPDWKDLYFASTRFLIKEDRRVLEQSDKLTEANLDDALMR